ncbi:MAG: DUF2551 domain-containing protein [Methanosarcinaceae archaeon]|nr:DUF2551 domain-containing protein [Methanosarcinaceae archaeon]
MFVLETIEDRVKERLTKYLGRDDTGIRKVVLRHFLDGDMFTTGDVYKYLHETDFDVSYRGVSAMVGLMNTRLGILSIDVTGDHNVYLLKGDYRDIVRSVLDNY